MEYCNYFNSHKMKSNKVVDLRLTNYKEGNFRNGPVRYLDRKRLR